MSILNIVAACELCNNDKGELHGNTIMEALSSPNKRKEWRRGVKAIYSRRKHSVLMWKGKRDDNDTG